MGKYYCFYCDKCKIASGVIFEKKYNFTDEFEKFYGFDVEEQAKFLQDHFNCKGASNIILIDEHDARYGEGE